MSKAILVCGHICSGKSSVIGNLSKSYGWNVISFGKYIRHLARIKNLPLTRDIYQTLGQEIFEKRGPHQFLQDVIRFNQPTSTIHLFDGVRHLPMLDAIRAVYQRTFIIYLEIDDNLRYVRFKKRSAQDDSALNYEAFLRLSQQPTERDISRIKDIADFSVNTSLPFNQVIDEVEQILIDKRFIG